MKKAAFVFIILSILSISSNDAFAEWVFQLSTGSAYNIPTPLKIEQYGENDIKLTAEYDTKAFSTFAYYYDIRVGKWEKNRAWEFESLHHKLFLSNKPDEVEKFAISHGYNLNTVNRAWLTDGFIYRLGAGFVMTHPETSVRGQEFDDEGGIFGFHISGLTAQAAAEKRFSLSTKIFLSLEAKLTASYARIPIKRGTASVPNAAVHGLFGAGYRY